MNLKIAPFHNRSKKASCELVVFTALKAKSLTPHGVEVLFVTPLFYLAPPSNTPRQSTARFVFCLGFALIHTNLYAFFI